MLPPEEPGRDRAEDACVERGWFDPAYVGTKSVFECLQDVIDIESSRIAFVKALQTKLSPAKDILTDRVTDLTARLSVYSNTLKFRLGMLSPERTGAWFRDSMRCTGGPFPQQILSDPVFNAFRPTDTSAVAAKLRASFAARSVEKIPFLKQESCLWLTLLELNREWNELCCLQVMHESYRLDSLPDGLPAALESQTLRAFLVNVRTALLAIRNQLDESYYRLWHASEQFFKHMQTAGSGQQKTTGRHDIPHGTRSSQTTGESASERRESARTSRQNQMGADDLRESMRNRRAHMVRQRTLTVKERRALEFMEFENYPDPLQLKKRYHALARKYHPDSPGGNEEEFKKLGSFYNYLVECLKHNPLSEG